MTANNKVILFPAKSKILFSGSPDRNSRNKLFTTYPIKMGQYNPQTYEYWIAFLLEYLKNKEYDIFLYDIEQNERVLNFVDLLLEKEIIKSANLTINDSPDLKRLIDENGYNSNESTFISDNLNLLEQCELIYPENRLHKLIKEDEKVKLLNYGIWNESKFSVVDWNTVNTKTSYYKYNAKNDLSILLPDLLHFS
jgi:hypothetical protein